MGESRVKGIIPKSRKKIKPLVLLLKIEMAATPAPSVVKRTN